MKIQFVLLLILYYSFSTGQSHNYLYSFPAFLGNNGALDSLVINKYSVVPKKFGDTLKSKELSESTFFKFNPKGIVISVKKYNVLKELKEEISYTVKNDKVIQIIIKNYKELPYTKTISFVKELAEGEMWTDKYHLGDKKYFTDSIKISTSTDSKTEEKNSLSTSSYSKTTYKYNSKGNITYEKAVTRAKKVSISYWIYDAHNLLTNYYSGLYLSGLGTMTNFSFYKNITDVKGNWTERCAYNKDGEIKYIENQILYYKKN